MPVDVDLAKELARLISAADTRTIQRAAFSFDPYQDNERLGTVPVLTISPENVAHERIAHQTWSRNVTLVGTMRVKQPPNAKDEWFSEHLDAWDAALNVIQTVDRVDTIETTTRFELEPSQNMAILLCQATIGINYND